MDGSPDLIAVCGANASGKTRLGVALARRYGGEILSVDSRQVYRGLDVGSGKDRDEYRTPTGCVPCHLIDLAEPQETYTVWQFQQDFRRALQHVRRRGRLPIAVGGTGLYLEAVLRHYDIPDVPADDEFRQFLSGLPREELEEKLRQTDPELLARTDRSSRRRLVRALEVARQARQRSDPPAGAQEAVVRPLVIGVRWERAELRARIAARLDQRLRQGLVDEVRGLLAAGLERSRLDRFGMEYRHVVRFLAGEVAGEQMREDLRRDIGRLAKRQETYFRGMERRGVPIHWVDRADEQTAVAIVDAALGR